MHKLKENLKNGKYSCAIIKEGEVFCSAIGKGVKPLLELYSTYEDDLKELELLDKVIGKAAAVVTVKMGIKKVYTPVITKAGLAFLKNNNIEVEYDEEIEYIENRDKTGMCPMEKTLLNYENVDKAYIALIEFIKSKS